jgi:hypothetical protein
MSKIEQKRAQFGPNEEIVLSGTLQDPTLYFYYYLNIDKKIESSRFGGIGPPNALCYPIQAVWTNLCRICRVWRVWSRQIPTVSFFIFNFHAHPLSTLQTLQTLQDEYKLRKRGQKWTKWGDHIIRHPTGPYTISLLLYYYYLKIDKRDRE